jgi:hypothetical protein
MPEIQNRLIDNARLVFKNFAGREGKYNREGDRSFSVLLDDKTAAEMIDEGWNVKELKARDEGDTPQKYVQVSVRYPSGGNKVRPPVIVMITSRGRNSVDEEFAEMIDYVDIANVDLIIRPYAWNVNGNTGVKAYLKSLYVTIAEDELALRYQDVPEIGASEQQAAIGTGDDDVVDAEAWFDDDDQKAIEA